MNPSLLIVLICFGASLSAFIGAPDYTCYSEGAYRYMDSTCKTFYTCSFQDSVLTKTNWTCPEGELFNPTSGTCQDDKVAVCIDNLCDDQYKNSQLPDPNQQNCTSYIQCFGITSYYPVVQKCPAGLYFVGQGCGDKNLAVC